MAAALTDFIYPFYSVDLTPNATQHKSAHSETARQKDSAHSAHSETARQQDSKTTHTAHTAHRTQRDGETARQRTQRTQRENHRK